MFISKKNRIEVYSYLFKEGVLVAKKDNFKPKHDEICLLYTSPSPRDYAASRMPSSA